MKTEQNPLFHHRRRAVASALEKLSSPTSYFAFSVVFSFLLGYLFASRKSQHPPISATTAAAVIFENRVFVNSTAAPEYDDHFRFDAPCADPIQPELVRQRILDEVFDGNSPFEDFPPAHITGLLRKKRVRGWGSNGPVFERLIRRVKPKTIIEVGTFLGASAIHMAGLTSGLGLRTQILCVDDFRGWPGFRDQVKDMKVLNGDVMLMYQFMQNVMTVNATESVMPVPFSTGSGLIKLCEWGVFADLIEVDAGHDFHSAWSDINRAYKLLRPGGVLFGHDYYTSADNKGVRRAVKLFAQVNGLRVRPDGQHWVIESR